MICSSPYCPDHRSGVPLPEDNYIIHTQTSVDCCDQQLDSAVIGAGPWRFFSS
jgi:hypothetical protein